MSTLVVKDRAIIYGGDIDERLAVDFVNAFLTIEEVLGEIEVICVGSDGGNYETAAMAMISVMLNSKCYITTYGLGAQSSSQALIFLAGDERYLSESSLLMFHDGSLSLEDMDLKEVEKLRPILNRQRSLDYEYLSSRSDRPPAYWEDSLKSGDFYLFPQQALAIKLIDGIRTPNK